MNDPMKATMNQESKLDSSYFYTHFHYLKTAVYLSEFHSWTSRSLEAFQNYMQNMYVDLYKQGPQLPSISYWRVHHELTDSCNFKIHLEGL